MRKRERKEKEKKETGKVESKKRNRFLKIYNLNFTNLSPFIKHGEKN